MHEFFDLIYNNVLTVEINAFGLTFTPLHLIIFALLVNSLSIIIRMIFDL